MPSAIGWLAPLHPNNPKQIASYVIGVVRLTSYHLHVSERGEGGTREEGVDRAKAQAC